MIAVGPSAAQSSHSFLWAESKIASSSPIPTHTWPFSPSLPKNLAIASARGPCHRVRIARSNCMSSRASTAAQVRENAPRG